MIPLIIESTREYRENEKIRLMKMYGSEDVGMETKHGWIQLDFETLVDAVVALVMEEKREEKKRKGFRLAPFHFGNKV